MRMLSFFVLIPLEPGKIILDKLFFSGIIDEKPLRFRGEVYHPYHFNCTACGVELNSDAREVKSRPGFTANDMVSSRKYAPSSHQSHNSSYSTEITSPRAACVS